MGWASWDANRQECSDSGCDSTNDSIELIFLDYFLELKMKFNLEQEWLNLGSTNNLFPVMRRKDKNSSMGSQQVMWGRGDNRAARMCSTWRWLHSQRCVRSEERNPCRLLQMTMKGHLLWRGGWWGRGRAEAETDRGSPHRDKPAESCRGAPGLLSSPRSCLEDLHTQNTALSTFNYSNIYEWFW